MATRPLRNSTETQRRAASAAAHTSQSAPQQTAQQQEISARDAKRAPSKSRSAKKRTHADAQQQEGKTEDTPMLQEEQREGAGKVQDGASTALQRRVEELALLVQQQAQQAEEQRKARAAQDELIAQLRASPVPSPQHPEPAPPRDGSVSPKRGPALHESSRAAAAAAQEQAVAAASQSRFARKEPRAQDLREYDGASGAKLDEWLQELSLACFLYELNAREALKFAVSRLRGAALQWWLALDSSAQAAMSGTDSLAAALRARFQPVTAARTARDQLRALRQGSRSVNDYIADFQRLRTLLPTMSEDDALHAFESGLSASLQEKLRVQGVSSVQEAIAMAARVGGLMQASQQGRQSLHQMDVDDGSGVSLDQRIQQAVLNAMQAQGNSGMGARTQTQTQRGYPQEREQRGGGRGGRGGQSGGRGGRFGMRSGPPVVPGVSEHVVRERWHAQQCLRCGQGGHNSHACPNTISASGN
jgi:hypothetical protein